MKTPSTDLFLLIRSLSPPEKKYFKQYSQGYSEDRDNKYLALFDAIDAQEQYDEEAIKKKFKGSALINNLSVAKIYLTEKILDSLIAMYGESDEALMLKKRISYFEILEKRRLPNGALNAYNKALDMAIDTGSLTLLPHITRYKNSIVTNFGKDVSGEESIANAQVAIDQARILENYLKYELINIKANLLFGDAMLHIDPKKKEAIDELLLDPLLSGEEVPLSFKAWAIMTRVRCRCYWVKNISFDAYDILKEAVVYLEENKKDTTEWQKTVMNFYVDFIDLSIKLNYFDKAQVLLKKLEEFVTLRYRPEIYAQQWHFTFTLIFHSVSGVNIHDGIRFWEDKASWWQKEQHKFKITTYYKLRYHVFTLYFMAGEWSKAISILNELITQKHSGQAERVVRIFWLMLQYEIKNIELLQSQASGIRDWFRKSVKIAESEQEVIQFFEKIHKANSKKEVQEKMQELYDRLVEHDKLKLGTSLTSSREMMYWLESKLTNTPLDKVLQSKNSKPVTMPKVSA